MLQVQRSAQKLMKWNKSHISSLLMFIEHVFLYMPCQKCENESAVTIKVLERFHYGAHTIKISQFNFCNVGNLVTFATVWWITLRAFGTRFYVCIVTIFVDTDAPRVTEVPELEMHLRRVPRCPADACRDGLSHCNT